MIEPRDERWSAWIDGELHPDELARLEAEFLADPRRRVEAEEFRQRVHQTREALRRTADRPSEGASRRALQAVLGGTGGRRSAGPRSIERGAVNTAALPAGGSTGAGSAAGFGPKKAAWLPFVGSLAAAALLGCAIFWAMQTPPAVGSRDEVASSPAPTTAAESVGSENEGQPAGRTSPLAERRGRPRRGETVDPPESSAARLRESLRSALRSEELHESEFAEVSAEAPREAPRETPREVLRITPGGVVADPGEPEGSTGRVSDREQPRFELVPVRAFGGGNDSTPTLAESLDSVLVPDALLVLADFADETRRKSGSDLPEGASSEGAVAAKTQPTGESSPSVPGTESTGEAGATRLWTEVVRQRMTETASAGLASLDAPPILDLRAQRVKFEAVERTLLSVLESAGRRSETRADSSSGSEDEFAGDVDPDNVVQDTIAELWQPAIDGVVGVESLSESLGQTRWFVGRRLSAEDPSVPMFGYESPGFRSLLADGRPVPDASETAARAPASDPALGEARGDATADTSADSTAVAAPPLQDLLLLIEGSATEVLDLVVALDQRLRTVDPDLRFDLTTPDGDASEGPVSARLFFVATGPEPELDSEPEAEALVEPQTATETQRPADRRGESPVVRLVVRLRPEPLTEKR